MPTPLEWTRRAADILLDERNKRYLGMTDYGTTADHDDGLAAADPSGLTSASGRCDVIVNNGMGEPTECGRTLPCQYHGPEAEGLRVALDRGLEAIRDTSSDPKSRQLAKSLIAALAATPPASGPLDTAWAEAALAADGRGWRLLSLSEYETSGGGWQAIAGPGGRGAGLAGRGGTPNDALRDLTARLANEEGEA